ncbi:MAG: CAP domain-containing protein, partial [Firmicutes bacterium]|nr:CAP domain-containing protein [Bacillota bacterium]
MKRFALLLTLALLVVFTIVGSVSAATLPPRWPQPAWFAQFRSTQPQPTPQPTPEPTPVPEPPAPTNSLTAMEKIVYDGINQQRTMRGLQPLAINPELIKLARLKSKDMAQNGYFAHRSPTYGSAYDMMRNSGIRYSYAGENLAKTSSASNAINLFKNSSTHRSTYLNARFNQTGVGIYQLG